MIKKILVIFFILIFSFINYITYATDEIITSQMEALNISSFVKEGEKYTKEVFPDMNLNDFLSSAIKGQVDNKGILNTIFSLFGEELKNVISLLGSILLVVVVHSILKSFSDNLENKGIGQIAYYIEYILIVTIVMVNFSEIVNIIKDTISNLVGFINCLVPILLALMSASRKCCFSNFDSTINNFFSCIYSKHNNIIHIANCLYCNSFRNNSQFIR